MIRRPRGWRWLAVVVAAVLLFLMGLYAVFITLIVVGLGSMS